MSKSGIPEYTTLCDGLEFPEGPIAMPDGSVLVVEVRGARLTRVLPDGTKQTVADFGDNLAAGPNGVAIGPDGAAYVANNGGFYWHEFGGMWHPQDPATGATQSPVYPGGSIDRVDLETGEITKLYTECDGRRIMGPNDIVFDSHGGCWVTDFGKSRPGEMDLGCVYYAQADGSGITNVISSFIMANGIGLSPDEKTLYVAETRGGRLWTFDLDGPGQVAPGKPRLMERHPGKCIANTLGYFDSLAVEADGTVVVAALGDGLYITSPDGTENSYVPLDDPVVTNVAFGGDDMQTAFVTMSASGRLISTRWPRPGLKLAY